MFKTIFFYLSISMLKNYLYILACLLCLNSTAQTPDSTKAPKKVRGFFTLKIGVNTIPPLTYNYDGTSSGKFNSRTYNESYIPCFSAGVFFSKRSFAEISCAITLPVRFKFEGTGNSPGSYSKKLTLKNFVYSALNYGYKIPLGKKEKGHIAGRVGFVTGATSVADTTGYFMGHTSGVNYKYFKKGIAIGYNTGFNIGFVLNKRTRFNVDCMYTYAVYFPTYLKTNYSYQHYIGAGQFTDGAGNNIYTYKPFSGPKIPINMLSLSVGLSWNF